MSGGLYGGDDVGAIVFDVGSHTLRCGYGGEEFPKIVIPSVVGVRNRKDAGNVTERTDESMEVDNEAKPAPKKDYFLGTQTVNVPRADTEIKPFMKDCQIEDWELFEQMLDYVYNGCLKTESKNHGTLFSEAPWNQKDKREKLAELMFEKYGVPSFYLVKNAVLTTFAAGRTAGLVLDSGATYTSACPVYEGYPLLNAVVKSPVGGDMIVDQCQRVLAKQGIELVPYFKIKSKKEVDDGKRPVWTAKKLPPVTESYDNFMKKQLVEDFAHSTLQLCDTPVDIEFMDKLPASSYGFPCGFRKDFLAERAKIPESLFDLKYLEGHDEVKESLLDVSQVAHTSCGMCDIDVRPHLYGNLLVTGGNSLIMGFTERLNHDLAQKCNSTVKLRVPQSQPNERKYGAWIGGSIVASLGTFQQLWISKVEYEETGKVIVERRCA
ncbi:unnamed protein product [Bursaphelenchus xylophilus]|uniref:(pine wood nematode) hypothetical protein n=1 Tax=Bursaphelenchus xylophilus TaxID=6326 RepID=A0A1I7SRT8_BURXY|nr:unnamed protein product [Bursaphelenchus xylophilus]CAG9101859.1 unnamed protein product [Bursaphelenchus xylophilus]